ncbi:hypothetical protein EDB19DRAFT_1646150, partial [Suillus lakei]
GLQELDVRVILGERLNVRSLQCGSTMKGSSGLRVARTLSGLELSADLLLLCTGQTPNAGLLRDMGPRTIAPDTGLKHTLPVSPMDPPPSFRSRDQ